MLAGFWCSLAPLTNKGLKTHPDMKYVQYKYIKRGKQEKKLLCWIGDSIDKKVFVFPAGSTGGEQEDQPVRVY